MSLQAIARSPRRWESETRCVNARRKGRRILERRVRSNGRHLIAEQLASTEPTQAELDYEYEKARKEAVSALNLINETYEAEMRAAHRKQREAIAALPESLRDLIECDYDYDSHYYYVY